MNASPAGLAPVRHRVRLWIPLILLLALLSPLLVPALAIFAVVLAAMRVNPGQALLDLGRFVLALRGTHIEVEAPGACVLITIV
jgi:hypothetical protein